MLKTERLRDQDPATNDVETVEDKVSAGQSEWLAIRHTNTAANTERGRPAVTYMERDEGTSREPEKIGSDRCSLKDVGSATSGA